MRIEFSVRGPAGLRDVAVTAPGSARLGTVLPGLLEAAGAAATSPGWLEGHRLHDADTIAGVGLRTGSVVCFGEPAPATAAGLRSVQVVAGPSSGRCAALQRDGVTVGRDEQCDLVLADERVSRRHARIELGPSGVTVLDCGSTNGTSVDGVAVPPAGSRVEPKGLIRVGDSVLAVRSRTPDEGAVVAPGPDGSLRVDRAPAAPPPAEPCTVDLPVPVERGRPGRVQWLAALLPAAAGAALAWTLSSPVFLVMTAVTPVLLLANSVGDRLHWRRSRRRDRADLDRRRHAVEQQIATELAAETFARRTELPDPATLFDIARQAGRRLWQHGAPGLVVRVGTVDAPAGTRRRSGPRVESAGVLYSVPHSVDLADGPLAVVGSAHTARGIARWLVAQLAVRYPPSEIRFCFVTGGADEAWHWCRWLPHGRGDSDQPGVPRIVVVDAFDGVPEVSPEAHPATVLWVAPDDRRLPAACRTIVSADDAGVGVVRDAASGDAHELLIERLDEAGAERLTRALAPYTEGDRDAGPPATCGLEALLACDTSERIRAGWLSAGSDAATPIGVDRTGPVTVDLGRDGPHALVVGTTGSGKSELLRTLVLGLATGQPPDRVTFVLVDYKGGAAFAELGRLPHTADVVTDLDPALTERALRSLAAELRRRERLFAAAAVGDLDGYRSRRPDEPLPRLVIVVDEFAELADEHPTFMTGLIAVARRGRSLGVHLVLATQRPSAVSAEIRANTTLRVALRVTEPNESVDVVGVPDAARIDPQRPGFAYLRVGDRVTPFQSARVVSEPALVQSRVEVLGSWRRSAHGAVTPEGHDLARAVDRLAAAARGLAAPRAPWLPPLPVNLPVILTAEGDHRSVGRLDLPDEQAQPDLVLPAAGGLLLAGRARSGRTTALVTTALTVTARRRPDELALHLLDADGRLSTLLAGLPHLGSAITSASAPELVPRLLNRLSTSRHSTTQRCALLLIDDWDVTVSRCGDALGAHWSELLGQLVRAAGDDLFVAVTGGRAMLTPRVAGAFGTRLLLALEDPADYSLAGLTGLAIRSGTAELGSGAGVRAPDGARFQLAAAPDPYAAVAAVAARWSGLAPASHALRLRPLPDRVGLAETRAAAGHERGVVLGLGGDRAEPCALGLVPRGGRLLVAGPARSGRTTALHTLIVEARRLGHDVAVWAPPRSALRSLAVPVGARLVDDPAAARPELLVVDDVERCDPDLADQFTAWLRDDSEPLAAAIAGRSDELATGYHPLVAAVRRDRCGLLLQPSKLDGELLGVRLDTLPGPAPPGRGVLVADPRWLVTPTDEHGVVPVQVAIAARPRTD